MAKLAVLLLMQYVVSTKAGLVNHVQGKVDVAATEVVAAGTPIRTGAGGFAEVLLNPGSFLRVGENSEVVIESVELTTIAVRVVSGSAVIEAAGIDKKFPIKVTTGELTIELLQSGIYVFANGKAGVREGKLQTADSKIEFKRGWQVDKGVAYRAVKLEKDNPSPVEVWSKGRSEVMAAMNAQVANTYRPPDSVFESDIWLFSATFGGYTYMPHRSYRSPYGQQYYAPFAIVNARRGEWPVDSPSRAVQPAADYPANTNLGAGNGGGGNSAGDPPTYIETLPAKAAPVPAID